MTADAYQPSSNWSNASSDGSSRGGQAIEQDVARQCRAVQLPIQLLTSERYRADPGTLQTSSNSNELKPIDTRTALVNPFPKPIFNLTHPPSLIPGHRPTTTQDAERNPQNQPKDIYIRDSYTSGNDAAQDSGHPISTADEEAAMRGMGYRLDNAQHHPSHFQQEFIPLPPAANGTDVAIILRRFDRGAAETHSHHHSESNSGASPSISPTEPQPHTIAFPFHPTSITSFRPPSPPPRPSCDVVARNRFVAASRWWFEIENVGCEDVISDGDVAGLDCSFDGDCDNDGDGELDAEMEEGARRASSMMQEWKSWSREWREDLSMSIGGGWEVVFVEERGDDSNGEGER